ncbi:MAG: radical SAM protein, partial [Planctomycetaceae bacterium]|nr:radical SAM protein [Planctomycetaceae bacterium]
VYRPMGPDSNPDLCLSKEEQRRIRKFVVDMRVKKPIIFVDAYYDHAGQALCPAATGITHHINPWGGIEPCPIVQFTKDNIHAEGKSLKDKLDSPYLKDFRELARDTTRGCIVLERPDLLQELIRKHDAEDGTARQTAMAELKAMQIRPSQYAPSDAIPERSWAYWLAKRMFFNDFHAYDQRDHSTNSAPAMLTREVSVPSSSPVSVPLEMSVQGADETTDPSS